MQFSTMINIWTCVARYATTIKLLVSHQPIFYKNVAGGQAGQLIIIIIRLYLSGSVSLS